MKCQKCSETATFHITELTGGEPVVLHLCADCARSYLRTADEPEQADAAPSWADALASQFSIEEPADEERDHQTCPVCGIAFHEFRTQGRLGCPHDYVCFQTQLEPLIMNIHGETKHVGKTPRRNPGGSRKRTELIRMRREMKEAVAREDYERASELRDRIAEIEAGND